MISLNILEKIKQELHLTEEQNDRYMLVLKEIDLYLEEKHIIFAENNLLAFAAHIVTLFMRLEAGEKVADMGDEVLSQLDLKAWNITRGLMDIVEKTYGEADMAESALITIHIQTALVMMQEGGN